MKLLFAILLFAQIALAEMPFTVKTGDETGLRAAMNAWYSTEQAAGHLTSGSVFWPWTLRALDYDGDNDVDLLACLHSGHGCRLFRNDGNLAYTDATVSTGINDHNLPLADGNGPTIFDLNNDGLDDIIGHGDISAEAGTFFSRPGGLLQLASWKINAAYIYPADFNQDGWTDWFRIYHTQWQNSWTRYNYTYNPATEGVATVSFPYVAPAGAPSEWNDLLAQLAPLTDNRFLGILYHEHDLNSDGLNDIALRGFAGYNNGAKFGRYCLRQTDGSCVESTLAMGLPENGAPIEFTDYNGDGSVDVMVTHGGASSGIYLNNGTGQFTNLGGPTAASLNTTQPYPVRPLRADFNLDGRMDLILYNPRARAVRVYENVGGAEVFEERLNLTGWDSNSVDIADFDNNGSPDFAIGTPAVGSDPRDTEIVIYLSGAAGQPPPPPPGDPLTITTPSPLPLAPCGQAYSQLIEATGGTGHEFNVVAGKLPDGLALTNGAVNGYTGVLTFTFTIRVTNAEGQSAEKEFGLDVSCLTGSGWISDGDRDETIAKLKWYEEVREPELWATVSFWQAKYEQLVNGLKVLLGLAP